MYSMYDDERKRLWSMFNCVTNTLNEKNIMQRIQTYQMKLLNDIELQN